MSGVACRLTGHVGQNPPQRVLIALDRDNDPRLGICCRVDGAIAVLDGGPVVPQYICGIPVGRHRHAQLAIVVRDTGEVMTEPVALRLGQVLNETQDGRTAVDQDAAQLFVREPIGLLQYAVSREREERHCRVELSRIDARYWLPLRLRHAVTVTAMLRGCGGRVSYHQFAGENVVPVVVRWPSSAGPEPDHSVPDASGLLAALQAAQ